MVIAFVFFFFFFFWLDPDDLNRLRGSLKLRNVQLLGTLICGCHGQYYPLSDSHKTKGNRSFITVTLNWILQWKSPSSLAFSRTQFLISLVLQFPSQVFPLTLLCIDMQNFHVSLTINNDEHFCELSEKRLSNRNSSLLLCSCSLSSSSDETAKAPTISLQHEGRRALISSILTAGSFLSSYLCTLLPKMFTV